MNKPLLTLTEAARLLGVHRSTVRQWARAGRLPFVWHGQVRRIPREALQQWLREKEQQALETLKR